MYAIFSTPITSVHRGLCFDSSCNTAALHLHPQSLGTAEQGQKLTVRPGVTGNTRRHGPCPKCVTPPIISIKSAVMRMTLTDYNDYDYNYITMSTPVYQECNVGKRAGAYTIVKVRSQNPFIIQDLHSRSMSSLHILCGAKGFLSLPDVQISLP